MAMWAFQFYKSAIKSETAAQSAQLTAEFQFYKSAIKRLMKTLIYIVRVGFNSTKVRLKENHATEYAWYYKFQFYKSAIKSNKPIAMADVSVLFQFYKSAIKSL